MGEFYYVEKHEEHEKCPCGAPAERSYYVEQGRILFFCELHTDLIEEKLIKVVENEHRKLK